MINRRDFLNLTTKALLWLSGLLGLGGLARYLSYQPPPPPPRRYEIGAAAQYPPGSRTVLAEVPALLTRTDAGFQALSMVCPHLGCTLEYKAEAFECPCHGSRFDAQGRLVKGPAVEPLAALTVEQLEDGTLVVIKS
ncbi:MAG: ubiquinol-cytochrome c reductase iron-sulfur subunit [Anaerolineae bacterium]|jgi:cytochrome b6-f complex iron-sulfur subunit|nr:ubiquinol-cytochrome c reductase iron-sulfur subunit [Anaerolineae bacterium]MCZ7553509.1 ubiquinol-cytochrome c reductase iron-sulfur subunit [Anaerolineales bacterium]